VDGGEAQHGGHGERLHAQGGVLDRERRPAAMLTTAQSSCSACSMAEGSRAAARRVAPKARGAIALGS
jgi:hypothetical protein